MDHDYLSTACLHELHERCRMNCKFCGVGCKCPCHERKVKIDPGFDYQVTMDSTK